MSRSEAYYCDDAERFVRLCKVEMRRYPRDVSFPARPAVVLEPETAKAIELSGIFRMSQDEIARALEVIAA